MSSPLVSFVVPCYNYGRYLPECLTSIFRQEGGFDFEVIAVDDASSDNTQAVLADFADTRLRVVTHEANRGHVVTVNEGFGLARGQFIARIDPDDRYRTDFLRATLPKFDQYPAVGLVYGDAALIDDTGTVNVERSDRVHGGRDFNGNEFVQLLETNCICAPTAIARRTLWQKALPVPVGLPFNDWYFNVTMARHADFYYVNRVLADYRVHSQNHHARIVQDKTEEPAVFALLDSVFAEIESSTELEQAKRRSRGRAYSAQYLTLADKYFGLGMNADARRCYLGAIRNRPSRVFDFAVQRRLAATIIGRRTYEYGKSLVKPSLTRGL
jgi:glycosyltransferase involved in cell wall biosynthesis